MKKNILTLFLYAIALSNTTAQLDSSKFLKVNLLLGGRWQSQQISIPNNDKQPYYISAILPYLSQNNIQGFGMVAGLEFCLKDRVSLSFKPVLRYDYLCHDYATFTKKNAWIWDLHANVGWKFKKNTVGLGYVWINKGKKMEIDTPPAPIVRLEFPAVSVYYTREIKKRFVAEAKVFYNYRDFPVYANPYNIPYPVYKTEHLFINLGCAYRIGLL